MKTESNLFGLWCGVLGMLVFHGQGRGGSTLAAADAPPSKPGEPILWSQLGARAGASYTGDGLALLPSAIGSGTDSGAQLRCVSQRLEGEATTEGLWLISTATNAANQRLQVKASAVGRSSIHQSSPPLRHLIPPPRHYLALPAMGTVEVADDLVRFVRPAVEEEYTVSMDGLRQDFVVLERPPGTGPLELQLAVTGARVEPTSYGAQLVLEKSSRQIAYSRLRVIDATGKELPARMQVTGKSEIRNPKSEMGLAVVVDDFKAAYPIRIDPTFSDANWTGMGGLAGPNNSVQVTHVTVVDGSGNLYIGGAFGAVGDVPANNIAKWNGSTWSALGSGIAGTVLALAVSGSDLYAGGSFSMAGGSPANSVAKWNGNRWSALGSGPNGYVAALALSGSDVYAGGWSFALGNGDPPPLIPIASVSKWNGSSWTRLGSGGWNTTVSALAVSGSDVYAGGSFTFTNLDGVSANSIASWNGSSWSAFGSGISNFTVLALAVSGSDLYAGGGIIAKWNGRSWSPLGSGVNGTVRALAVSGSDVYAGGEFWMAGGSPANYIAKWNGSNWSALGSGMNDPVYALAVSGSDLYAGGWFTAAGLKVSAKVARAALGDAPGYNRLTGTALSSGAIQLSYIGYPATNYALDRAFNLAAPISWVGQQTNAMSVSGLLMFTNALAPGTNNFWRVRSVP